LKNNEATHQEDAQQILQLGNMSAAQGQMDQAIAHYERALSLNPDYVEAHNNLGLALATQGRMDQAIAHYERALSLRPDALIHNNLGNALAAQGRMDQAIAQYEHTLSLRPDYVEAHSNLGNALAAQGRADQAIAHYERALSLRPDYAEAHNNLGNVLMWVGRFKQALAHYQQAVALQSNFVEAHSNLGLAHAALGNMDQAAVHYERALSLRPDYVVAHSNLLLTLNYASASDPESVYAAHRNFAQRREVPLAPHIQVHSNNRSLERRLKIGYVSSDFRQHSVAWFIEPVLENHSRERFEIYCYANHFQEDEVTQRLMSHADHWRRIFGLSDDAVANQIRADCIDILVDLNGHTGKNRLLVFARKPAPLQVTWLGYPNTTGLSAMDYRITDAFADPVGMTEPLHSEKLMRLPDCFSCYQPPRDVPAVSELPARSKGYITFGSFNKLNKVTPAVMALWARILHAVPNSRLILKTSGLGEQATQESIRELFAQSGVAPERLELLGHHQSRKMHLEQYRSVDIGLDPFPYNGTTTTCEALWMGVPVVTLAGKVHAGRVGVSQLSNLGLTELIGQTPDEYVAIASRLAADLEHLGTLRKELRDRMTASPLTDAQGFTKNLERTYLGMWKDWCLGSSP
jgi:predicted O-linked N-acetylglucosamine transferase (SPINDLY family)